MFRNLAKSLRDTRFWSKAVRSDDENRTTIDRTEFRPVRLLCSCYDFEPTLLKPENLCLLVMREEYHSGSPRVNPPTPLINSGVSFEEG